MNPFAEKSPTAKLADELNVPDHCYEQAQTRYRDLGEWLSDKTCSKAAQFKPHVFPQGSFRLGIVISPLQGEDYDLDVACALEEGISPFTHTQRQLKELIGADLESYRKARNIKQRLEPKHRCWRIHYQDLIGFHIDKVPGVRFDTRVQKELTSRMEKGGLESSLAQTIAQNALAITDDRHHSYSAVSPDWPVSNPEGYALWFESRMKQANKLLESQVKFFKVSSIDKLPIYKWKTPLQQALQLLKRHRDVMFKANPEGRPISVILTTLAAWSYRGESSIEDTLDRLLSTMDQHIKPSNQRVPNPVNPIEDFADKWNSNSGRLLRLEENFHSWLAKARIDFSQIAKSKDLHALGEMSARNFGVTVKGATAPAAAPVVVRKTSAPAIITSSSSAA